MYKLILIFILLLNYAFSNIVLDDNNKGATQFQIPYYLDYTQKLNIDEINNVEFTDITNSQFTHGYTTADVWYKLTITNNSDIKQYFLYVTEPFFEKANLFFDDNGWEKYKSGLFTPLEKRLVYDSNPTFPITLQKGETKTFYLQTYTPLPNYGEIKLLSKESFITKDKLNFTIGYMYFFGGLSIIILINGFLYFTLREKIYLYYVGYVFFYTMFVFIFSGFNLYVGLMPWHYELHLVAPLFIFFLIKFSIEFLNIEYFTPVVFKILNNISYVYLFLAVAIIFAVEPWYEIVSSISTLVFGLLIYSVYKALQGGYKKAKLYFFAISFYMITITMLASMVNGWIENNDIHRYSFLFGSFIEMIFFTLILANRYYDIKNEKIKLQQNMLKLKEDNQIILEQQVQLRTQELEDTNKQLQEQAKILKVTQDELQLFNDQLEKKVQYSLADARKKDKLLQQQSRLAQMGEMISMIAHQWRQPLSSINSAIIAIQTKLYSKNLDLSDKHQREEYFAYCSDKYEHIKEYINYLSTTIDDFRNFFKPDKNKEKLPISLPIKRALKIIGNSLETKSIRLDVKLIDNDLVEIYPNEMIQVIINMIKNSEDVLLLRDIPNPRIEIECYDNKDSITIKIADNGGGIDKKIMDKIFDPYFSTKQSLNGTGLGLYMCKLIIEKHNKGTIKAINTEDGVAFYITLQRIAI